MQVELSFTSELSAPRERVWEWITSVTDLTPGPGGRLARSWLLLGGVVPIDPSDLTLTEIVPGRGFVEESPMRSMRLWRHERWITPTGAGARLTDRLRFEPRVGRPLVARFVARSFAHRHRVLRRRLGDALG